MEATELIQWLNDSFEDAGPFIFLLCYLLGIGLFHSFPPPSNHHEYRVASQKNRLCYSLNVFPPKLILYFDYHSDSIRRWDLRKVRGLEISALMN
jgi:hypothetical protein